MKQYIITQRQCEQKILRHFPQVNSQKSGIYVFTREADGVRYAYVGQAVNLLYRIAQHLNWYGSHIDKSLKKHGLWCKANVSGWKVEILTECDASQLNIEERYHTLKYAQTHQMRNATLGGQGKGKVYIKEIKPARGYRDGLKQGRKNAAKDCEKWFKNLDILVKGNSVKSQNSLAKFKEFLKGE